MKHYQEFSRTGHTFAERVGGPTEVDAAFGMIARNFSLLEDMVRGMIQIFMGGETLVATIATAEMSFRQSVDVMGSLARYRIGALAESHRQDSLELLDEVLQLCRKSEELRNTYLHSSYGMDVRVKTTAKASHGLRTRSESIDSALLLDVADFISETAWICQELPVDIRFVDEASGNGDTMDFFRDGKLAASFTLPGWVAQPNQRLQPTAPVADVERRG